MARAHRPQRVALLVTLALALFGCAEGGPQAPPTPRGLVATPGNGAVTLTWPTDKLEQKYSLYWSTSSGVDTSSSQIPNVSTPFQHTGLENGVRVYYRLMSRNDHGKSDLSPEVSAVPHADATSPGAPASVIATAGDGQVTLTWGLVPDATAYTLYRDTQPGVGPGNGTAIPSVGAPPYDDLNLTNGVTYYYVLTAWANGKESLPSAEVNATPTPSDPPSAPTGLKAAAGDAQVTLTWNAVSGADSYTLYWATATGVTPQSGTAIPAATSPHLHPGLQNNQTYYYVVTATRGGLESPASDEASATPTSSTLPTPPSDLAATAGDAKVTLSWSPVPGATSYNLYFGTTSGVTPQNGTKLAGASSPYAHTGLVNGQTYYYVVTTVDPNGESPPSGEASATPNATPTHGSVSSFLSNGAYAVVLFENMVNGQGLVQLLVYDGDPNGSPPGTGVTGLTVTASGTVSGPLLAASSAGLYQNTTSGWLTSGAYTFTVKGSITGTVTAAVNDVPTCTVTGPTAGSALPVGKDLTLAWSSTNSDKAQVMLQDTTGTTTYPPLTPDPGQATLPGGDIPNKGTLSILVSALWSAKDTDVGLLFLGDCGVQVLLQ